MRVSGGVAPDPDGQHTAAMIRVALWRVPEFIRIEVGKRE